jgi:hypothetical protein
MPSVGLCNNITKINSLRTEFVSIWKTDNISVGSSNNNQVKLPTYNGGTYNCIISWGDGLSDIITAWNDAALTHTYAAIGTYPVRIYGQFEGFRFNNGGDKLKLLSIDNAGDLFRLGNNNGYFYGCSNLTHVKNLNTTGMTNFYYFYRDCINFDDDIDYDSSAVTQMYAFLYNCSKFNKPLNALDTALVTDMSYMLNNCTLFNQDLSFLNISNVAHMTFMLNGCSSWSNSHYSDALIAWQAKPHKNSVDFKCVSKYEASAAAARTALIGDLWAISDGGPA